jgi:hypothetical protein
LWSGFGRGFHVGSLEEIRCSCLQRADGEFRLDPGELQHIAVVQDGFFDDLAVDARAVGRAEVLEVVLTIHQREHRVALRHRFVIQLNDVGQRAADRHFGIRQDVGDRGRIGQLDGQRGHEKIGLWSSVAESCAGGNTFGRRIVSPRRNLGRVTFSGNAGCSLPVAGG